ncbi:MULTISPECIES: cell division protein FtsB [Aliivibrio]|jgi:cell division protein FtsB|uniref:Cell division protein FtsB n=2 Tax=Aliivibrio logei TaxID=688 RepID=A0A1B9NXJ6_ALILO|nr:MULTISPECIES: cell division protein FtsB [Aliivibrio]MBB1312876.1 cell division protein FtsB [Aliivibrio sp. SR45-2]OCH20436.1 cell division protein FtsB [Aliivibrio logei]OEF20110.1 cell division protein FtsB [Aliivibrio logei 5S-186]
MRAFAVLLIIALGWLQYTLWFGKNGMADYAQVSNDVQLQEEVNQGLRNRNGQMFAEIDDLRKGSAAIEERARHELGMIKKGETFYRIIDENSEE